MEDVGRARGVAVVVVAGGTDHDGSAVNCHGVAEGVARGGVGGRQLRHLGKRGAAVGRAKDVDRAQLIVVTVTVVVGPDHDGIPIDRHGSAEFVVRRAVRGCQLRELRVVIAARCVIVRRNHIVA